MMQSKMIKDFRVGDGIVLYGWRGTVLEVRHELRDKLDDRNEVIGQMPCTYVRVHFDNPDDVGYQYEGGWYGGSDDVVSHGYFERQEEA